ncbi:MAG: hypothetical protein KGN40_04635, partial [Burkholderiales bacterium]|nr:hypothetical protein [Burkholderiales bacterium]
KSVDLPTLGSPTMPHFRLMGFLAIAPASALLPARAGTLVDQRLRQKNAIITPAVGGSCPCKKLFIMAYLLMNESSM